MDVTNLRELKKQVASLKGKPLQDHRWLLQALGNYFQRTLPSNLDNEYVLTVEVLLNDMYLQAIDEEWSSGLQNALLEATSKAAYLSDFTKRRSGRPRSPKFFKTARQLGRLLLHTSRLR